MAKAVCRLLALDCDIVGTVADGSAVLEAAQRRQPDVIVVDISLPIVSGLEACRQLTHVNPEANVIMFSAWEDPDVRQRSFHFGASAFVGKGRATTTCYRPSAAGGRQSLRTERLLEPLALVELGLHSEIGEDARRAGRRSRCRAKARTGTPGSRRSSFGWTA